mgnify:CR=1 FL=1|jgi:hypothetical protein
MPAAVEPIGFCGVGRLVCFRRSEQHFRFALCRHRQLHIGTGPAKDHLDARLNNLAKYNRVTDQFTLQDQERRDAETVSDAKQDAARPGSFDDVCSSNHLVPCS